MQPKTRRALQSDRGEVASWLILCAGLALAAALASSSLGQVFDKLTDNVAAAAAGEGAGAGSSGGGVDPGPGGDDEGGDPETGDDETGDDETEPPPALCTWTVNSQEHTQPCPDRDEIPDCGDNVEQFVCIDDDNCIQPSEPGGILTVTNGCVVPSCDDFTVGLLCWTPEGCLKSVSGNNHCDEDGNCTSFDPLGCSDDPRVHEAIHIADRYELCSGSSPNLILCNNYPAGIEAVTAAYLRAEFGMDPGEVYRMAAEVCAAGHPGCEFSLQFADWYHEYREVIMAASIAGDLIPAPPGVKCLVAGIDGFTKGDAIECAIGSIPGVPDIPIPSGAIDDALEGDG